MLEWRELGGASALYKGCVSEGMFNALQGISGSSAESFRLSVLMHLRKASFPLDHDVMVGDRGDGKRGKVHFVVEAPFGSVGVCLSRKSPRTKHLYMLEMYYPDRWCVLLRNS